MSNGEAEQLAATRMGEDAEPSYRSMLWERREFAFELATSNLRAENASTSLGLAWWIINPLLLAAVYYLVFGVVLRTGRGESDFLSYLLVGIFAFTFTKTAVSLGPRSILKNARLLTNVRMPRLTLPISATMESFLGFLISMAALICILLVLGTLSVSVLTFWILPAIVFQLLLSFGLSTLAAALVVPFRDIGNVIPFLLRIWLYVSPIIWPLSYLDDLDASVQVLFKWNPMFGILSLYRAALTGVPLDAVSVWIAAAVSASVFLIGIWAFRRTEPSMTRYL